MSKSNGDFDIGDVVCLSSGSLPMTVIAFTSDGDLVLAYSDLNGNFMRETLPPRVVSLTETRWTLGFPDGEVEFDEEEDEDY